MTASAIAMRPNLGEAPRSPAFLYCGQGSQTHQMGRAIYEADPAFRAAMDELDTAVAPRIGGSVIERLYHPSRSKSEPFDDITFSHPAIFMIELALTRALAAGRGPGCLVGSSLGELTAAVVCGAMDLDDALDLIAACVETLRNAGEPGAMLAVLATQDLWLENLAVHGRCELAADFGASHFVISGPAQDVTRVQSWLVRRGISVLWLPVSHAFHSAGIDRLWSRFEAIGRGIRFRLPTIPVISCVTCDFVDRFTTEHLWRAIRAPLLVARTIERLQALNSHTAFDLGPGSTFAPLFSGPGRARDSRGARRILTPLGDEMANFEAARGALVAQTEREIAC